MICSNLALSMILSSICLYVVSRNCLAPSATKEPELVWNKDLKALSLKYPRRDKGLESCCEEASLASFMFLTMAWMSEISKNPFEWRDIRTHFRATGIPSESSSKSFPDGGGGIAPLEADKDAFASTEFQ